MHLSCTLTLWLRTEQVGGGDGLQLEWLDPLEISTKGWGGGCCLISSFGVVFFSAYSANGGGVFLKYFWLVFEAAF